MSKKKQAIVRCWSCGLRQTIELPLWDQQCSNCFAILRFRPAPNYNQAHRRRANRLGLIGIISMVILTVGVVWCWLGTIF